VLTCNSRLKCDRNVPCSNCIARKTDCVFAPQARDRNRVAGLRTDTKHQVDARIQRLEQLVNSLIYTESQPQSVNLSGWNNHQPDEATPDVQRPLADIESGRIVSDDRQTVYVSGSHWASISYEVGDHSNIQKHLLSQFHPLIRSWLLQLADIRDHFDQATQIEPADILESRNADGPMLLNTSETPPDLESILSDVPPKDIATKLVSRYFNGVEFPTGTCLATVIMRVDTNEDCSDHPYADVRPGGMYVVVSIIASDL
jgi:hypothetical protein